ncbi:hypothetical protein G6W40_07740 [Campylobacter concisus]|uniref:hypothetical protein n=1 Tax=Campylobacter concisus TaxID=199 RepID=UPI000CD8C38D|nr:hypothetical protein [Campylobacter concisus]MBE9829230.1 hypothetical protein [Campylobacter concisus]MBE9870276.1 hypothetical protein [Campylobacter concisus]MCA6131266.1 hypothetical protein [Campylobacter concisus]QPI00449.1 hypothetical protein G5B97_00515 [Campylobacter concisus]
MQLEDIKAEIKNQNAYNKILERIAKQVKKTEKAQVNADKEKQKLEMLLEEKRNLMSQAPDQKQNEQDE